MGEGVRVVTVQSDGVIKEPDRLANYVRLVATALDQLARTGGAYHEAVAEGRTYGLSRRP